MRSLGAAVLVTVACSLTAVVRAADDPPSLSQVTLTSGTRWAAGPRGQVALWNVHQRLLRWWGPDGKPLGSCRLPGMAVPDDVAAFAWRDGTALLTLLQPSAGQNGKRRALLIDAEECTVERQLALQGWVMSVAGSDQGWVVELLDPETNGASVVELDDEGRTVWAADVDRPRAELVKKLKLENLFGASGLRVLPAGRDVWLLPNAAYELWFPPQHARSLRRVTPPECLDVPARRLGAEESLARVEARLSGADEMTAARVAPLKDSEEVAGFMSVVAAAAAGSDLAVLAVRDSTISSGRRLDIWDLDREAVVAILPASPVTQPVAITYDRLWLLEDGRFLPVDLEPAMQPLEHPCDELAKLHDPDGDDRSEHTAAPAADEEGPSTTNPTQE